MSPCFHGWARCKFCHFPAPKPKYKPIRCSSCGRFMKKTDYVRCGRCRERGFVAIPLPMPKAKQFLPKNEAAS